MQGHTLLTTYSSWGLLTPWMLLWDRASPLSSVHFTPNLCIFQVVMHKLKCQANLTNKTTATLIAFFFFLIIAPNPSEEQILQDG